LPLMPTGPPQAFKLHLRANFPDTRRNLDLNQNENRKPRFATVVILGFVKLDVNPVFSTLKVRSCKPVPCP